MSTKALPQVGQDVWVKRIGSKHIRQVTVEKVGRVWIHTSDSDKFRVDTLWNDFGNCQLIMDIDQYEADQKKEIESDRLRKVLLEQLQASSKTLTLEQLQKAADALGVTVPTDAGKN